MKLEFQLVRQVDVYVYIVYYIIKDECGYDKFRLKQIADHVA